MHLLAILTLAAAWSIPFDFVGDEIFVPVCVNGGKPVWFALDSAASSMILDAARARELGLKGEEGQSHGAGAGPVRHMKLAAPVSLRIGPDRKSVV